MYPSLLNFIEVKSPRGFCPFSPVGFAFAMISVKVTGTDVTGTVPEFLKFPDMIIF